MSCRLLVAFTISATVLLPGCKKQAEPASPAGTDQRSQTAASPAASAAPAAPAAAGVPAPVVTSSPPSGSKPVIASGEYAADSNLRCDVLEVKRVSGGALLVKWRLVNTQASQPAAEVKPIHYNFAWDDLYYVDPAENKKYSCLTDTEGNRILDVWYGNLPAGEQHASWSKFPAPPASSTKISLYLPKFPPFEDVSVAE